MGKHRARVPGVHFGQTLGIRMADQVGDGDEKISRSWGIWILHLG